MNLWAARLLLNAALVERAKIALFALITLMYLHVANNLTWTKLNWKKVRDFVLREYPENYRIELLN
ncbi:MAG: hypothetical protein ACI84C_000890 [Flavobacteriales bacterium]